MFERVKKVITAEEVKKLLPVGEKIASVKADNDETLRNLVSGKDKRFLLVCGPCSADNEDAVAEYCVKLKALSDRYDDRLVIVPRVFTAKPRTNGEGYLGMMYQPEGVSVDVDEGVRRSRGMMLRIIEETGLPISDELLYPEYYDYNDDLVSYYFIGARSSENPEHRNVGSGLGVAVGVKNSTGGNLMSLAGSVYSVNTPKEFLLKGEQVRTEGNPYAHAVFRGFVDESGVFYPNYSDNSLRTYLMLCENYGVINRFVMVDCSHANSSKQTIKQIKTARSIIRERNKVIGSLMLESYLFEGRSDSGEYGVSRTDNCIGFEDTESLVKDLYDSLG